MPRKTGREQDKRRGTGRATTVVERYNVRTSANDRISEAFESLVPEKHKGTDRFLDVVFWNIRFFNKEDPERVETIAQLLAVLNADLFIFEEIYDGAMDGVADRLRELGAGTYSTESTRYGTTGGQQRVCFMWDLDFIRSKDETAELFPDKPKIETGEQIFPRLPLWGYFEARSPIAPEEPFDFQLLGLHLKSQRGGGGPQRKAAAAALAQWMTDEAPLVDADVIAVGDWNEPPDAKTWKAIHDLETKNKVAFRAINDADDFSHLFYKNKQHWGSRLDMAAVSIASMNQMIGNTTVVRWKSLEDVLATNYTAKELKAVMKAITQQISDHLPVVMRFYFSPPTS